MKTKHYTIIAAVTVLFSFCKKKTGNDPAPDPEPQQQATYYSNLRSSLIITRNSGNFDTSFSFKGIYMRKIGSSETLLSFPTTNYNGYSSNTGNNFNGNILSSSNFLQLAAKGNWDITSSEFGNFQYNDSIPVSKLSTSTSLIPLTFSASQGIPIKLDGLENSSYIYITDKSGSYYFDTDGIVKNYSINLNSVIQDTIRDYHLDAIPLNSTFTLSIFCSGWSVNNVVNGHQNNFLKSTVYNYALTRIN